MIAEAGIISTAFCPKEKNRMDDVANIAMNVKLAGFDEATDKLRELMEKFEKAKSLIGELASAFEALDMDLHQAG